MGAILLAGITDIDFLEAIETRRGVKIEDPDERNARYNGVPSLVLGAKKGLYQYVIPYSEYPINNTDKNFR